VRPPAAQKAFRGPWVPPSRSQGDGQAFEGHAALALDHVVHDEEDVDDVVQDVRFPHEVEDLGEGFGFVDFHACHPEGLAHHVHGFTLAELVALRGSLGDGDLRAGRLVHLDAVNGREDGGNQGMEPWFRRHGWTSAGRIAQGTIGLNEPARGADRWLRCTLSVSHVCRGTTT